MEWGQRLSCLESSQWRTTVPTLSKFGFAAPLGIELVVIPFVQFSPIVEPLGETVLRVLVASSEVLLF